MEKLNLETFTTFCKENGFLFAGSEIYGGLANAWDYGPLGTLLLNNVKAAWTKKFVQENASNHMLDSSILMNPKVWEASGHLKNFGDALIECKDCHNRFRADKFILEFTNGKLDVSAWEYSKIDEYIKNQNICCTVCKSKNFAPAKKFLVMMKTFMGPVEETAATVYLRPETVQGIFVNFKNIQKSLNLKLPFGICQVGKSFRNEITPGKFIFRTREFEQMEQIFFCKESERKNWYEYWKKFALDFLLTLNIKNENLRYRRHEDDERAFYCAEAYDIEYKFPWGFDELWGLHDRTNYDLTQHQNASKVNLEYFDQENNSKFVPHCVETAMGPNRLLMVAMLDAYFEDRENDRIVLKLHPFLSPYKACVLPLIKKTHSEKAKEVFADLSKEFMCSYDESGAIGKRYKNQDKYGTPFCITVDDETLKNNTVTIRDRDTMKQETIKIEELENYIAKRIKL